MPGQAGREPRRAWVRASLLTLGVLAGVLGVHRFWLRDLSRHTGEAAWVWVTDALSPVRPAAGLFVASLELEAQPSEALLKVCGDREYVVWVNGTPAACGWSRPGYRLDLFDVGHLLHQGANVLGFEVRSPTTVGGLLVALDIDGVGRNVVTSGSELRLRRRWELGPLTAADLPVPVVWGAPPRSPWGYPRLVSHPRTLDGVAVDEPVRVPRAATRRFEGGWEFTLPTEVSGYLWLEFDCATATRVATSGASSPGWSPRAEAQPVVRLPGQRRWLDPEPRAIARIVTFGPCVPSAVEVWPVPAELLPLAPGRPRDAARRRWTHYPAA